MDRVYHDIQMKRFILIIALLCVVPAFGTNYYVSKSTGSDSNAGTATGTAWAHLPGMASASGGSTGPYGLSNTGGYQPHAGDTFILMGCDVWVNADLPVIWNWNGS